MATVVTRTLLNVSLCVYWLVSNIFKLNVDGEVTLYIYVKLRIVTIIIIIIIVLIDTTSQILGIFIYYTAMHYMAISLGYQFRPISSPSSDVCIVYNFRKNHAIVTDICIGLKMAWVYAETGNLEQCFATAGPRPGIWPRHQLNRAARGSPGICHFSFLSIFNE